MLEEIMMPSTKISTHMIFMGVEFLLAVLTMLPTGTASKNCLLGYNAHCSFTPISTLILLALVGLHFYLNKKEQDKG
jgi:hypothetical protein